MAHEFGHLLGLVHTSDTSEDSIMDNHDVFDWDIDALYRLILKGRVVNEKINHNDFNGSFSCWSRFSARF